MRELSLPHDYIPRVDLAVYILLATGSFSIGAISHCMVGHAAVQVIWHCGGRRVRSFKIYNHATRESVEKGIDFFAVGVDLLLTKTQYQLRRKTEEEDQEE